MATGKIKKVQSRPQRWATKIAAAQNYAADLDSVLEELQEIQSEYQDWRDNMPENLEQSTLGEKLDAVCELDFQDALGCVQEMLNEADSVELPLGFGRD